MTPVAAPAHDEGVGDDDLARLPAGEDDRRRWSALRRGDWFAAGFELGVTVACACWVLPFEPDDLASVGVVVQSNPGSE
jgi:hypothetical protein